MPELQNTDDMITEVAKIAALVKENARLTLRVRELESGEAATTEPDSVETLRAWANTILALSRSRFGIRSACVVMIGIPLPGQSHDRFAAGGIGSCLMVRGLLTTGNQIVAKQINDGDTSLTGGVHP